MKKLLILLMLLVASPAFAIFDSNTQTLTSTSTSTATATNAGNGGAGGTGGSGGVAVSGSTSGDSSASTGSNTYTSTQVKQDRVAPAVYIGAASNVDGIGITTPFGGAVYNKGNRFQQLQMLAVFKEAHGMDISREIQGMERETQETAFLGILPLDTPFGLGQMKPLAQPTQRKVEQARDPKTGRYISIKGNSGNLPNGLQA